MIALVFGRRGARRQRLFFEDRVEQRDRRQNFGLVDELGVFCEFGVTSVLIVTRLAASACGRVDCSRDAAIARLLFLRERRSLDARRKALAYETIDDVALRVRKAEIAVCTHRCGARAVADDFVELEGANELRVCVWILDVEVFAEEFCRMPRVLFARCIAKSLLFDRLPLCGVALRLGLQFQYATTNGAHKRKATFFVSSSVSDLNRILS